MANYYRYGFRYSHDDPNWGSPYQSPDTFYRTQAQRDQGAAQLRNLGATVTLIER
jgi:hypothetical protein